MTMLQDKQWVDPPVRDCYHYYSDGTICSVLFADDKDFVYGMNLAAILSFLYGIKILSICLMDNHFHMVLKGPRENCRKFALIFHRQLARFLPDCDRPHIRVSMDPINSERQLMNVIVYVQRNCISAGYAYLPSDYPWGTGDIFFRSERTFAHGTMISETLFNDFRSILRTHVPLPRDWEYDEKGMLLTHYWIDWQFVNDLFETPSRYLAFQHQKKDDAVAIRMKCRQHLLEDLSQKDLRSMVSVRCNSLTGKPLAECSLQEKLLVAQEIWSSTCGYSLKSIARAVKVDPEVAAIFLK